MDDGDNGGWLEVWENGPTDGWTMVASGARLGVGAEGWNDHLQIRPECGHLNDDWSPAQPFPIAHWPELSHSLDS